jgi:hypothetical protein
MVTPPDGSETTSVNIDRDHLRALLDECVRPAVEKGFGDEEVQAVERLADEMAVNDERDLRFDVQAGGKELPLQVRLFMDDHNSPDLSFFSGAEVIKTIDANIARFLDFDFFAEGE